MVLTNRICFAFLEDWISFGWEQGKNDLSLSTKTLITRFYCDVRTMRIALVSTVRVLSVKLQTSHFARKLAPAC